MSLPTGARLGSYEITGLLDAGGLGRARRPSSAGSRTIYWQYVNAALESGDDYVDRAEECARKVAFERGFHNYPYLAEHSAILRKLDDQPRFQSLLPRARSACGQSEH